MNKNGRRDNEGKWGLTYQGSVRLFLQIMLPREELQSESNLLVEVQTQIPLWKSKRYKITNEIPKYDFLGLEFSEKYV